MDADAPDVVFVVRRAGLPDARRTVVGIDIGGGALRMMGIGEIHRVGDRLGEHQLAGLRRNRLVDDPVPNA